MSPHPRIIPVILLKTRSLPDDVYEEHFTSPVSIPLSSSAVAVLTSSSAPVLENGITYEAQSSTPTCSPSHDDHEPATAAAAGQIQFTACFVPVLEHKRNDNALGRLGHLLRADRLRDQYGGMIFTSQRAVEGWADTVENVKRETSEGDDGGLGDGDDDDQTIASDLNANEARDSRTNQVFTTDVQSASEFAIYVVGPATSRALTTLLTATSSPSTMIPPSDPNSPVVPKPKNKFHALNPTIQGSHTGNGAKLAAFILNHYNNLHAHRWFSHYEAPRLPFIPLLGMGSENYSRKRLEADDPRLRKKPLLFLVGEQRRDIIPRTLMDHDRLGDAGVISVEEVEVYSTTVRNGFRQDFDELVEKKFNLDLDNDKDASRAEEVRADEEKKSDHKIVVIVVFSPQGSLEMLQSIGYITKDREQKEDGSDTNTNSNTITNTITNGTKSSTSSPQNQDPTKNTKDDNDEIKYIIVTIGPTTRDFLRDKLGIEPHVCAKTPSPQGVQDGIVEFLSENHYYDRLFQ